METVREEFDSDVDMEQSFEVMSSEHEQLDNQTIPKCPWEPPGPNISTSNEDNNLENSQYPGENEQRGLNDLNRANYSEQRSRLKIEELNKTVKDLQEELRKTREGANVHEEKIGNIQERLNSILKMGIFFIIILAAIFVQWNVYGWINRSDTTDLIPLPLTEEFVNKKIRESSKELKDLLREKFIQEMERIEKKMDVHVGENVKCQQQTELLRVNSRDMEEKIGKIEENVKRDNEKVTNDINKIRVKCQQQTELLRVNSRDMEEKIGKIEENVKRDNEKVTNDINEIRVVQRTNEAFHFSFKFTGELEAGKHVAACGPIVHRLIKNDHFNEEDCTYTAPIAGIYLFIAYMAQSGSGSLDLFLETTGGSFDWSRLGNTRVDGEVVKGSVITKLSKGAKVHLSVCLESKGWYSASPSHLSLDGILIVKTD